MSVGITGASYASWAPTFAELWRLLRVTIACHRLRWLWKKMITALPHVQFDSEPAATTLTRTERAEYRLYRRTLEIRDAQLALRPIIPPHAPERTPIMTGKRVSDPSTWDIACEAAELISFFDAQRAVRDYACAINPALPHPGSTVPNLLVEAAWLSRVSRVIRRRFLAARMRERTTGRVLRRNNQTCARAN